MVADAGQKEIAKCYKFLVNVIKEKVEMVTPASLVRRFCAVLGLGVREMKAAEEMARAAVPSEGSTRSASCLAHLVRLVVCVGFDLEIVKVETPRIDSMQHSLYDAAMQGTYLARPAHTITSLRRPEDSQLRPWDGKSPASVAGAVIYAISSLPKAEKHCSALEIAQVGPHCLTACRRAVLCHMCQSLSSVVSFQFMA